MMYGFPEPDELMELVNLADSMDMRSHDDTYSALYTALIMKLVCQMIADGRGEYICSNITYIQEVLRMMSENFSKPLSALTLASHFGISKTKFHADFRFATGASYKEYLTNIRLSYAYVCFLRGMDIVAVSLECGYSSESHFIQAFRRFYGMTPGECIQKIQDGTLQKFV